MRSLRAHSAFVPLLSSVAVFSQFASVAYADSLWDLTHPGGTGYIEWGDKRFDNFTVTITGPGATSVDTHLIDVAGMTDDVHNEYGLRFAGVGGPAIGLSAGPALSYVDVLIGFDVSVLDPDYVIEDIRLSFDASAPGGAAQIVETVFDGTKAVGQAQVFAPTQTTAHVFLEGTYPTVRVLKDIALIAGADQSASITWFTQTFSQIPEPTGIALLVCGALLALFARRRLGSRAPMILAVTLGMAGLLAQPTTGSAMTLQDLIDDPGSPLGSLSGDLEFRKFGFEIVGSSGIYIASASEIEVEAVTMGDEEGLRFAGLIAAMSNIEADSSVTINLDYEVKTLNLNRGIYDISLSFNGATTADGWAQLGESVLHLGSSKGEAFVTLADIDDHKDLTDGPYTDTLHVHSRIIVEGGDSGYTTISFINQTFSQVPEPAAIFLLGLGLPAILRIRRR